LEDQDCPEKVLRHLKTKTGDNNTAFRFFSVSIIKGVSHFADVLIIIIIISRVLQAL